MARENKIEIIKNWVDCYIQPMHFSATVAPASYFDNRWHITTSIPQLAFIILVISAKLLGFNPWHLLPVFFIPWGPIYVNLPIYSKWTDECDPPEYGIKYHNDSFWFYLGGKGNMNGGTKTYSIYAPWSWQWYRTSTLLKDMTWFDETKGKRLKWESTEYGGYEWLQENKYKETHDYKYTLKSGEVQNVQATISVKEREWRMHWFKWVPFIKKTSNTIDIDFSDEVGERKGSWKGGCLGCNYEINPGETYLECLRRMETERKFN